MGSCTPAHRQDVGGEDFYGPVVMLVRLWASNSPAFHSKPRPFPALANQASANLVAVLLTRPATLPRVTA